MNKYVHDIVQYIWLPFMLGFVLYVFQSQHDPALAIVLLIAFSALYTLIRIYFATKKWYFLAATLLVVIGVLGFYFLRPQGLILTVNGQRIANTSVVLTDGKVIVNPAPGSDGRYSKGTVVSLTAIPNDYYEWKNWTSTGNDIVNPTSITLTGSKSVEVAFEERGLLIINNQEVIGALLSLSDGSGSVQIEPNPDPDGRYSIGTIVHLTAESASGYDWKSWTGTDTNTTNPAKVTIKGNKQVTVSFQPRFNLIISNEIAVGTILNFNEGSVSLNPPPGDDDKYAKGTVVTLTANPDPAYGLKTWSGTGSDSSNPTTVTINSDKHVTVTFELRYALTVNGEPVKASSANFTEGTVSFIPSPLADGRYAKDTLVRMTATPAAGYRFDKWGLDASGVAATSTVSMNSEKNINALFIRTFNLTTSVNPAGSGNVTASPAGGLYDTGSTVLLTASPAPGYRFDYWSGNVSGNATSINVSMNDNKNATAVFKKTYTLTTSVNPAGSGTIVPSGGSFDEGTVLTLSALPSTGFTFIHWEGDASGNSTATANMTANRNIIGVFKSLTP